MADKLSVSATGAVPAKITSQSGEIENLPVLLGRLGDEVLQLVDTKLNLLKVEVKEDADLYVRDGSVMASGAAVAGVGFALLSVAIALLISLMFQYSQPVNYLLGFVIVGAVDLILGGIVVMTMKNRLGKRALVPERSVEELRKDKQWLKNET